MQNEKVNLTKDNDFNLHEVELKSELFINSLNNDEKET